MFKEFVSTYIFTIHLCSETCVILNTCAIDYCKFLHICIQIYKFAVYICSIALGNTATIEKGEDVCQFYENKMTIRKRLSILLTNITI